MNEKQRFSLFKSECEFWIDELYLNDIDFVFLLVDTEESDDEDEIASTQYNYAAHRALIMLSSDVDDEDIIKEAALHEVLEVFLMPTKIQSINMADAYHPFVQRETHAVIHRLMKLLRG